MEIPPRPPHKPLVEPGQVDHQVADLTAHLSADATLSAVQTKLGLHNQWLPIDGDPAATIGHLVNTNSSGPLRLGYGAWRDLLLGCQFLSGRGDLVTAGGQTMKNVAGYDLTKFMVGQSGFFGKLVSVTVRTYKRPTAALVVLYPPDVAILNSLLTTPSRPQWAIMNDDTLFCGYLGDDAAISFYQRDAVSHHPLEVRPRTVAEDVAHRLTLWKSAAAGAELSFRASVPPTRIWDFVRAIKPPQWIADPAFGILLGTCPSKGHAGSWLSLVRSLSGNIQFRDPATGALVHYTTNAVEQKILQNLKRAFDPRDQFPPLPAMKV